MEVFKCRTRVVAGPGAVACLKGFGARRVFLVADPYFAANGTADRVAAAAEAEQTEVFKDVRPDPTVELVAAGAARLRAFHPDLIVALGGGSAIDSAKAMAFFSQSEAKLAAIPTTSGSGSEVTDFAVLTHEQVKHPLIDKKLQPELAILDSDLLQELPPSLVADAGFDVLTHAAEAFVARDGGVFTDALAREAFVMAYSNLPASFAGNRQVRLRVHQAATMAGMAFSQAGLGLCHAMSHSLGGMFHIPHGRLNAILLPAVIRANAHGAGKKYASLARSAGISGSADSVAVRNLCSSLTRLRRELKLPETLAQAGVDPAEVWARTGDIVRAALADPCCEKNPVRPEDFVVRQILEEVTGHV